ncbi:Protein CBG23826 [Caenorhabditis briggsae]|uniref:Protein CBG23826 n=1 Tax=Caenorhabditis briggsae TaxID=6238 RepID=A8WJD9_CAEBR|nr:Protein CBG23826 [Caenorhabditis briggsae]CAP20581.1 Protein CBG23826 [Caenorhabditis briggsae]
MPEYWHLETEIQPGKMRFPELSDSYTTEVAFDSAHKIVGYCTIRVVNLNRLCAAPFYAENPEVAARLLADVSRIIPNFEKYEKLIFWYPSVNKNMERTFSPSETQTLLTTFSVRCDFIGNPCAGYIVVSDALQQITVSQLLLEGWTTLKPSADFYGMGLVNTYFRSGHEKTWQYVQEALSNPQYQNYDVYVTGHSLGGALAGLAAPRIVHDGLRQSHQVKVITFGEPRVGNLDFSRTYDQLIPYSFRVTHAIDIVPHLPACVKDLSYTPPAGSDGSMPCDPVSTNGGYHHGLEIWYPGNMTQGSPYMICTGLPRDEDFSCSNAPKVDLDDTTMGVWDHRNYFGVETLELQKMLSGGKELQNDTHIAMFWWKMIFEHF